MSASGGRWWAAALGLALAACGSTGAGPPDHPDASSELPADAGLPDSGRPSDGRNGVDAGPPSACSAKPILGPGTRITVDTTAIGETGTVAHQACLSARAADGEGNAVGQWTATINGSPALYFDSAYLPTGGAPLGTFPRGGTTNDRTRFFPLAQGWLVVPDIGGCCGPFDYLVTHVTSSLEAPDGGSDLTGAPPYGFTSVPGGGVAAYRTLAEQEGGSSCPPGGPSVERRIVINRWDAQGVKGPYADLGCYPDDTGGVVAGNAQGDVLAIFGGERWHLAPDGGLSHVSAGQTTGFIPLIGGLFAERAGSWNVVDAEGTIIAPGPQWLANSTDLGQVDIVLGGTAYLLHHFATDDCGKALELVLDDGTSCGFVDVQGPSTCPASAVTVGLDGTITALDAASCTLFLWKGAVGPAPPP